MAAKKKRFSSYADILTTLAAGHGVAHDDCADAVVLRTDGLRYLSGAPAGLFMGLPLESYYQIEPNPHTAGTLSWAHFEACRGREVTCVESDYVFSEREDFEFPERLTLAAALSTGWYLTGHVVED